METLAYLHLVETYDVDQQNRKPPLDRLAPTAALSTTDAFQGDRLVQHKQNTQANEVNEFLTMQPIYWMMP